MQSISHKLVPPLPGQSPIRRFAGSPFRSFRRAFTLMEMMVSIGILVIVILSVGVIFQAVGKTVGVSQASMEMLSNVRSIQAQMQRDVAGMDKNGFLVIRCNVDPSNTARRIDQISFISRGSFPNRTGSDGVFTDNNTVAPAAFVWWGQLAIQAKGGSDGSPLSSSTFLDPTDSTYKVPLNQVPTGLTDGDFILGRHTTLLVPQDSAGNNVAPAGLSMGSYPAATNVTPNLAAIDWGNTTDITAEGAAYDITQARIAIAQGTPGQIMATLMQAIGGSRSSANVRYEADHFCYRYAALRSITDGVNLVNGYFRMHPVALPGVSSFAIDWTDGTTYSGGGTETDVCTGQTINSGSPLIGTTKWFGMHDQSAGLTSSGGTFTSGAVDPGSNGAAVTPTYGAPNVATDIYTAVFSYNNRPKWPVALRFRYHIADPTGRLQNGRDFVEIVKLPS